MFDTKLINEIESLSNQEMNIEDSFFHFILENEETLQSAYIKGVYDGKIDLSRKILKSLENNSDY